jgi:hypothetical protein
MSWLQETGRPESAAVPTAAPSEAPTTTNPVVEDPNRMVDTKPANRPFLAYVAILCYATTPPLTAHMQMKLQGVQRQASSFTPSMAREKEGARREDC